MKTAVKKIDGTKREVSVEVTGDVVSAKFKEVFEKIGKNAKVAGFRPGHVPMDMLEKNFSAQAHEEVLKELVPDVYNQAVDKEGLDVVELPTISEVKLDRGSLSFKAVVEVSPAIELKKYRGLSVRYKKPMVTPDEVKRHCDALKESNKIETLDERFARSLGYPDAGELERGIERGLLVQQEHQQRQAIEAGLLKELTAGVNFTVPASLVKRQQADLVRQAKIELAMRGASRETIEAEEKKIEEQLLPQAESQVRTYLVLAAIAKKEGIPLDDHMPQKVVELLLREAEWQVEGGSSIIV